MTQTMVLASTDADLQELADRANAEHEQVESSLRTAVVHAMNAGDALLAAKAMVEKGRWGSWLIQNFHGTHRTACFYMRFAFHRAEIEAASEPMTQTQTCLYLRGLPPSDAGGRSPASEESVAEARRLRQQGLTYRQIGDLLAVSPPTVRLWLDPQARKKHNELMNRVYRKRKAERLALQQKQCDVAAKKKGGALAESYSLLRKTAKALDRAKDEAGSRHDRAAILSAMTALHKAEDELKLALGIAHGRNAPQTIAVTA